MGILTALDKEDSVLKTYMVACNMPKTVLRQSTADVFIVFYDMVQDGKSIDFLYDAMSAFTGPPVLAYIPSVARHPILSTALRCLFKQPYFQRDPVQQTWRMIARVRRQSVCPLHTISPWPFTDYLA